MAKSSRSGRKKALFMVTHGLLPKVREMVVEVGGPLDFAGSTFTFTRVTVKALSPSSSC
jgi:hypothetical protein